MDTILTGKKIIVTGGTGFIGSHLVNALVEKHNMVVVIDNLSSGEKRYVNPKAVFYQIDVRSKEIVEIFKKEKPEIVFHLAAYPLVEKAYQSPREVFEINIMGTVNVLEACRELGDIKAVVIVSSDKAYGKTEELPCTEDSPLQGDHPYEASKSATDLIAKTYYFTYQLPVIIARFSNVFGPRDLNLSRLIPGILTALIKKEDFLVRSDGTMVREYTYINDIVEGCIQLVIYKEKTIGEAFNFGSKNILSVKECIEKIQNILGQEIHYKILNSAKNEIPTQYLSWEKVKKVIGWEPKTSFEDGIKKTFAWYQRYYSEIQL